MAAMDPDCVRQALQKIVDDYLPITFRQFWDVQVEGSAANLVRTRHQAGFLMYDISISSGRLALSPKAGAPC